MPYVKIFSDNPGVFSPNWTVHEPNAIKATFQFAL